MIEDLVLHAGDFKTGSTSIQWMLAQKAYRTEDEIVSPLKEAGHDGKAPV